MVDIERICPTEVFTRRESSKYVDFLCELKNRTLLHVEFQYNATTEKLLEKFHGYNQAKSIENGRTVNTMVFNFQKLDKCAKSCWIGQSIFFRPVNIFLGDIDFEKRLNNIEEKVLNSIQSDGHSAYKLSIFEEIDLVLTTLVPQTVDKEKSLRRVCYLFEKDIIRKERNHNQIRLWLNCQIEHFIDEDKQKGFKKMLMSDRDPVDIFRDIFIEDAYREGKADGIAEGKADGIAEGKADGIAEGKAEGIAEGKAENTEKIVLNLLSNYDVDFETVSDIVGIDVGEVIEIRDKYFS